MQEKRERALVLLSGVLQDGAAADFARAMREDDPALYARAYAKLLEEDKQRGFADYLGRAILYDDNLFARRAFLGKADGDVRAAFLHDMAALQALAARADDLPPRIVPPSLPPTFVPSADDDTLRLQLYNPLDDSARLKAAPGSFEELRGNYPLRREHVD